MNSLLILMHDTANDIGLIGGNLFIVEKLLEGKGIKDDEINEFIARIKKNIKDLNSKLDSYYNKTKE